LNQQLNMKVGMVNVAIALSRICSMKGDFQKGRILLEENIATAKEFGVRMHYLWMRAHLGYLALCQGETSEAGDIFAATTREFYNDKSEIGVAFTVEGIAGVDVAIGKTEHAPRFIGWADAIRKKVGDTRPHLEQDDVDKIITACIAKMGEVAFSDAYDAGRVMTLDEAVALALDTKSE